MITMIAAVARDGAIGRDGKLPWHMPEDLAHFKLATSGHAVIMGRKTWESLPITVRPLPGRFNIVLSNDTHRIVEIGEGHSNTMGCRYLADALRICRARQQETDIIGGASVYEAALPFAQRLDLTEVDQDVLGADAFFPHSIEVPSLTSGRVKLFLDKSRNTIVGRFRETSRRKGHAPGLTFVTWEREGL